MVYHFGRSAWPLWDVGGVVYGGVSVWIVGGVSVWA